jgi:anti-sigma factor RsiW
VTCDEVREQLPEHLLGTLDPATDVAVGAHLRGCTACRRDMVALADGVSTFAAAAHDVDPPEGLRDRVLGVLEEEWAATPPGDAPHRRGAWAWRAAAAAALVAALAWGAISTMRASDLQEAADKYEAFLGVLGGEDVRVGELRAEGSQELHGSVVIYDSKVGQSWVLVLVRAPGREGEANVTMVDGDRNIDLHPVEFDPGGEGSTWLVTPWDLTGFERVNLWNDDGLIASAAMRRA